MPTGARLVSAIYFAFFTYVAAHLVHSIFEAEIGYELQWGNMKEITAGIGLFVGWFVMGSRAGEGMNYAVQGGILSSVSVVFWGIVLWSVVEMVTESMKMKYRGAPEAVVDTFRIALEYGATIGTFGFIATMLVGGIIGGWIAEQTARRST